MALKTRIVDGSTPWIMSGARTLVRNAPKRVNRPARSERANAAVGFVSVVFAKFHLARTTSSEAYQEIVTRPRGISETVGFAFAKSRSLENGATQRGKRSNPGLLSSP